ncbi:MAG TPA: Rrf2 family transcriptional regulator [Acidimicrobiia bacterium]|nr:Rrf2 family transcriptional regulator [Acidimicrobiia bacterium]
MGYRLSAKVDYAVRVTVSLAAAQLAAPTSSADLTKAEDLARSLGIPPRFLVNVLSELRRAGLVASQRGTNGGYLLAQRAAAVMVGDVVRAIDPEPATGDRSKPLSQLWDSVSAAVDTILDGVSLADLVLIDASGSAGRKADNAGEPIL